MKTFDDLDSQSHPNKGYSLYGNFSQQATIFFPNGYGASVITGTGACGKYELAVIKGEKDKYTLCYDTHITDDVIACDSEDEITSIIESIQSL